MRLSARASRVEPFYAMEFTERAARLASQGRRVVTLSLGQPDFGAPPQVLAAMREVMDGRALPYTPAMGLTSLREAIAGFYGQRHGLDVDARRIVITSGASSALLLALAATVEAGEEVIMADPSYPCYRELADTFSARSVLVPTSPATRFQLDEKSVAHAFSDETAAVLMASPSNPTGTSIPFEEMEKICEFSRERGAWRIVDEIYLSLSDHAEDGTPARSVLSADADALVINSFSKYFGMTGWRLGWAVLPDALVEPIERLATNYFLCASAPAQMAALAAFSPESLDLSEQRRRDLLQRRGLVLDGLSRLGLPVTVPPDGAFYAYVDVSGTGLDSWTFCERALEEVGVSLTPGRDFGTQSAHTHVRLSYASSPEELGEGLERLGRLLETLGVSAAR